MEVKGLLHSIRFFGRFRRRYWITYNCTLFTRYALFWERKDSFFTQCDLLFCMEQYNKFIGVVACFKVWLLPSNFLRFVDLSSPKHRTYIEHNSFMSSLYDVICSSLLPPSARPLWGSFKTTHIKTSKTNPNTGVTYKCMNN